MCRLQFSATRGYFARLSAVTRHHTFLHSTATRGGALQKKNVSSQLPLNGHLVKADTSLSGHMGLVPAVLQSFTSSPSKADTSLRRTVGAGPERVRLRGS